MSVCVSFQAYTRRRLWSDRDQIWHTHADSSPRKGSGQNKNLPRVTQGGIWGVLGGQKFQNVWKSAKWLDRLAPNLAHMCGFIGEWT